MREAIITCLCNSYRIEDLGLKLKKDQIVTLSEERASSSNDLLYAHSIKAISWRWEKRCEVVKDGKHPAPPFYMRHQANFRPSNVEESSDTQLLVTKGELEDIIKKAVKKEMESAINLLVDEMRMVLISYGPSKVPHSSSIPRKVQIQPDGEEPVFIPSNLVSASQAEVRIQSESSSGSNIGEALNALKKMKK